MSEQEVRGVSSLPLARPAGDAAEKKKPADFVPLRLVLLPTRMHVDLLWPDQLVGRHSGCDVRLPLSDVSRRHCRFVFASSSWQVVDLESLNGTFVNNQKVQRAVLRHQDRVRIGGFTFEVQILTAGMSVVRPEEAAQLLSRTGEKRTLPAASQEQRKAS